MRILSFSLPTKLLSTNGTLVLKGNGEPTPNINPPEIGTIWVDTKTGELFVCLDNTFNKNIWKSCCSNKLIKPLDEPFAFIENATKGTFLSLSQTLNEFTLVFYGEGWKTGNYHYFFHSYPQNSESNSWANDAYYGNGFTVRKNCGGFSYKYLNSPPGESKLVVIFSWNSTGVNIKFFDPSQNFKKVYSSNAPIPACPMQSLVIGAYNSKNDYSLGGTIYRAEIYDKAFPTDQFPVLAQKIVERYGG